MRFLINVQQLDEGCVLPCFQQWTLCMYTTKLLFHQSPTRHSDYTVTITVTMQSLFSSPRHCDYRTVTTSDTHIIRYPLPWGLCRNLSTRYLTGNCTVTTWEDTRYLLHTVTVQESRWHRYTVLQPSTRFLVGERIVTTSSLSCHSTVTT